MSIKIFTPKYILDKKEFHIVINLHGEIPKDILHELFDNNYITYYATEIYNSRCLYERMAKHGIKPGNDYGDTIIKTNVSFIQFGWLMYEKKIEEEHAIPLFLELFQARSNIFSKIKSLGKIFSLSKTA